MVAPPSSSTLPGLIAATVTSLAGKWDDRGLWEDVLWLSDRFWAATPGPERVVRWHHLVMAVGNFKRQPGRRLHPARPALDPAAPPVARPETLAVPGTEPEIVVHVEELEGWEALRRNLRGAGVPTITTLLAALWPERHFVFDWRVRAAANGLRIHAGLDPTPGIDPKRSTAKPPTFEDYQIVRRWLFEAAMTTETSHRQVERALYRLAQKIKPKKGRSWQEYSKRISQAIPAVPA